MDTFNRSRLTKSNAKVSENIQFNSIQFHSIESKFYFLFFSFLFFFLLFFLSFFFNSILNDNQKIIVFFSFSSLRTIKETMLGIDILQHQNYFQQNQIKMIEY